MALVINIFMAWTAVFFMFLLVVVYGLRLWIKNSTLPKTHPVRRWNRSLRKSHKWLALLAVLSGFVHGLYSSVAILSKNKGTILWLVFLLLGFSYYLRKLYSKNLPWVKVHRLLAFASVVLLVLHVVEVGGFVGIDPLINALSAQEEAAQSVHESAPVTDAHAGLNFSEIPDGTYVGEATGYNPGLKAQVTITGGQLTDVVVIAHNEVNKRFWGLPVERIPATIVERQKINVDVVSGATMTSLGIMKAVENALMNQEKAELSETLASATRSEVEVDSVTTVYGSEEGMEPTSGTTMVPATTDTNTRPQEETYHTTEAPKVIETTTLETRLLKETTTVTDTSKQRPVTTTVTTVTETKAPTTSETTTATTTTETRPTTNSLWNDGTYRAEATGFNDGLVVDVTIEGGTIIKVTVVRHNEEGSRYWGRPVQEIPKAIVQSQSTNVDVVSGASYTSRGIIKAVNKALQQALK